MARQRCAGRCGKSLPMWLDICRDCAKRDDDVMALTAGGRAPAACAACGRAVAPGRTCRGLALCSHCEKGSTS